MRLLMTRSVLASTILSDILSLFSVSETCANCWNSTLLGHDLFRLQPLTK
jgi:hypothetical protein